MSGWICCGSTDQNAISLSGVFCHYYYDSSSISCVTVVLQARGSTEIAHAIWQALWKVLGKPHQDTIHRRVGCLQAEC